VDREVLEHIAIRSEGDLRAAVRDLESIAFGRTHVTMEHTKSLGTRDTTGSLFDLMRHILKGRKLDDVRKEVWDVDATPDDLVLWVDENMAKEFKDPKDLVAGYEMLSRADIFLGRTRSTQDYALWAYASELGTLGVMASRSREYRDFVPFGFPQWLSKMGRTKGLRQTKDRLAETLGRATHASKRKTRTEQVETFAALFQMDREFAVAQAQEMDLTDEEVVLLLGPEATGKAVQEIRAAVAAANAPPEGEAETPKRKAKADVETFDDGPAPEKPAKPKPGVGQKGLFGF
jgi:replication factor C large subunit